MYFALTPSLPPSFTSPLLPSLRQGIGTELVGTIESLFRKEDMATIVADTPESNVPARRFLEKLGFGNPISVSRMNLFRRGGREEGREGEFL